MATARLIAPPTTDTIVTTAATGRNDMPAFGAIYSPEDLQDVAAYILETQTSEQSDAATPAR